MEKAEKLITECSACQTCTNFNPECKDCVRLNNMTLARVERILTNICNKRTDTKTANTARERLAQLTRKSADTDAASPAEETEAQGPSK
jgi:hypothetical protein